MEGCFESKFSTVCIETLHDCVEDGMQSTLLGAYGFDGFQDSNLYTVESRAERIASIKAGYCNVAVQRNEDYIFGEALLARWKAVSVDRSSCWFQSELVCL